MAAIAEGDPYQDLREATDVIIKSNIHNSWKTRICSDITFSWTSSNTWVNIAKTVTVIPWMFIALAACIRSTRISLAINTYRKADQKGEINDADKPCRHLAKLLLSSSRIMKEIENKEITKNIPPIQPGNHTHGNKVDPDSPYTN